MHGATSDMERFSTLVGDIYDASLDPGLWPSVFDEICEFVGCRQSSAVFQDVVRQKVDVYLTSTVDPHYRELFQEQYFKLNPIFPAVMFSEVGRTVPATDVLPREEFVQTRFAREWLTPQGYLDAVFTTLDKSPTSCTFMVAIRNGRQGLFDEAARRRFALVVPHVRRAIVVGKTLDLHKVDAAALADSLDTLASGMFLVDGTGRIVHANVRGRVMVSQGDVVRAIGGKLGAADAAADQALLDAFTSCQKGDTALGRKGVALPIKARDQTRYVAHVLPLTSGARRKAGASYSAVATVFVQKAALDLPSPSEAVAREFNLTAAELRVLFAIIEVGGVPEVAEALGVSEATVKTHLHRLFAKTGARRQVDLTKLVAGYANALTG
jgi:DNA-binding CsgD family transcriptional regulator